MGEDVAQGSIQPVTRHGDNSVSIWSTKLRLTKSVPYPPRSEHTGEGRGSIEPPAVSIRRSVHRDYLVCLECESHSKALRRRISRCSWARYQWIPYAGTCRVSTLTAPAY